MDRWLAAHVEFGTYGVASVMFCSQEGGAVGWPEVDSQELDASHLKDGYLNNSEAKASAWRTRPQTS